MVVIFVFSVIPSSESGLNAGIRAHAVAYSVLSILMVICFRIRGISQEWVKGVFLAGAFGLLIECIQYFIPYRKCDIDDIIINYFSAIIALFPGYFIIKLLKINNPSKQ
jgi:VanZ family protein